MDTLRETWSLPVASLELPKKIIEALQRSHIITLGQMFTVKKEVADIFLSEKFTLESCLDKIKLLSPDRRKILVFDQLGPDRRALLARRASALKVSVRARAAFQKLEIHYVGDLIQYNEELLEQKNFGKTTLRVIEDELERLGFSLETRIVGWSREKALEIASQSRQTGAHAEAEDGIYLEEQIRQLFGEHCSQKYLEVAIRFYGLDGDGRKTLE